MPPMITDDDASDVSDGMDDVIPAKKTKAPARKTKEAGKAAVPADEEVEDVDGAQESGGDDDDDDDDEEDEDEYAVEKILAHGFDPDGTIKYEVKWLGYDDPTDQTWEPEENLTGVLDMLKAYHKKIGGKPVFKPATPAAKGKGRGKRKSLATEQTPEATSSTRGSKKRKTSSAQEPAKKTNGTLADLGLPVGSWEDDVEAIQTIEEKVVTGKNGKPTKELYMFISWKDGRQIQHSLASVRQKCPQKLLDYLLSKLVFKSNDKEDEEDSPNAVADEAAVDETAAQQAADSDE